MQRFLVSAGTFDRKSKLPANTANHGNDRGFTMIELMIVVVVIVLAVMLAVPTYQATMEKRRLVSAAEEIVSFMQFAQGEAVKRNEKVTVSWYSPGSHNVNWCIGAALTACDCTETVSTEDDFCAIDSVPYRLTQSDFVDMSFEFLHMRPASSSIAFDPVRGIVTDIADAESVDGDWLFYIHSDMRVGWKRLYELQLSLYATGRTSICADDDRFSIIGGYPVC